MRRTLTHGIEDEQVRAPGNANDAGVFYDRTPWYPTDTVHGAGTGTVDWTACGPPRPELHMRAQPGLRTMAGTSQSRFFANPLDPTIGLHSYPARTARGNIQRYGPGGVVMRPGRQDRLTQARTGGSSYSQTTRLQGR